MWTFQLQEKKNRERITAIYIFSNCKSKVEGEAKYSNLSG